MITRGSKYFYAAAGVSLVMALLYGFATGASDHGGIISVFQEGHIVNSIVGPLSFGWKGWVGDHVGYGVLMGFAAVMGALGGFSTAFRDGDAEAVAQIEGTATPSPVVVPFGISPWPIITAFSAASVIVGLALSNILFVVGLIGLVVGGFEWTVRAWSERATGDPALNRELRNRIMLPIEVPVGAVLLGGLVIFCVSRVLLAIPEAGGTALIIGLAVVVFGLAFLLASRPELKRSVIIGLLLLGGVLLIGGGIAGGIYGTHDVEKHGAEQGASLLVSDNGGRTAPVVDSAGSAGY